MHLLKDSSKPCPKMRKRVKLSIYNEEEEREKSKMIEIRRPPSLRLSTGPNIIGNAEDRPNKSEDGDKSDGFITMSGARTP